MNVSHFKITMFICSAFVPTKTKAAFVGFVSPTFLLLMKLYLLITTYNLTGYLLQFMTRARKNMYQRIRVKNNNTFKRTNCFT